ncbi:methyltransferase domain-containing protein [Paucihalobacter sp.]|uniref:methyltransferase domain-containing protein n=1 Tax=Paucihalobacter sp. TaxID=2850405 RepID=UPI002FDFC95B
MATENKIKSATYKITRGLFDFLTQTIGNFLVVIQPKKARKLSEQGLTLVINNDMTIPERLMRGAIFNRLEKTKDFNRISELHQTYWSKKGTDWLSEAYDLFETDFLPNCTFLFELLKQELSNHSEQFKTLVEIGTGNGKVLKFLSLEFPEINRFVGIDLSPDQVNKNIQKFNQDKKLEFVVSNGSEWVKKNGGEKTIFVTSGGVLEYFTESSLAELLKDINALGKTFFVAIEPTSKEHNFEINPNSQVHGREWSFSHNYSKLFKDAGFDIWHYSQKPWDGGTNNRTFIGAKN